MRNTETRIGLAHRGAKLRRRDSQIVRLGAVCCGLLMLDVVAIGYVSSPQHYHSPEDWMYGATLLPSNAGSYVLVAVVTFVIAVAVTVFSIKHHEKTKQEENKT